jgi:hypothetical protein
MEHSLHIAAKHFVEAVAPATPTTIRKKVNSALKKAHKNGHLDLDNIDTVLSAINGDGDDEDDEDDEGDINFTSGDSLGKAIALVKQVYTPVQSQKSTVIFHQFNLDPKITTGQSFFQGIMQSGWH